MIGQTISHYRVLEKLGEGGMGVVYLAEDTHLGRRVAIKFLASLEPAYRARFLREARAVSTLNHPNIAAVYDYGETSDGHPYIVMELVKGETIGALLDDDRLTLAQSVNVVASIAEALGEAHRRGIVHRDVKPSNVVISERGQVKVLDFGLVKHLETAEVEADQGARTIPSTRTRSDVIVGTPLYLSPEQATGKPVDGRSDLFALGALLYECITGRSAFSGASVIEIGAQVIHVQPPTPSRINPGVPPSLDAVTMKALEKKVDARYQTAEEMLTDLHAVIASLSGAGGQIPRLSAHPTSDSIPLRTSALTTLTQTLRRPRVSLGTLVIAVIALAIGIAAVVFISRPKAYKPSPVAVSWYDKGMEAMRNGLFLQAKRALEQAIREDDKYALAMARLAEALAELDYADDASNSMLSSLALGPDRSQLPRVDALYLDAIQATVRTKFADAIKAYEEIAQISPDQPHVYFDLGRAYEKNNEVDNAIQSYIKATNRDPQLAAAFLRVAVLYSRKGERAAASANFEQAEKLYQALGSIEGQGEVFYERGFALNKSDEVTAARQDLERALEVARTAQNQYQEVKTLLKLGDIASDERKVSEARNIIHEALNVARANSIDNLTKRGLIDLGNTYMLDGNYEDAKKYFAESLELAQKHHDTRNMARAQLSLGSACERMSDMDGVIHYVGLALPYYLQGGYKNEASLASILLARATTHKGEFVAALQAYEQYLTIAKEQGKAQESRAHSEIGILLTLQGNYPEALPHFESDYVLSRELGQSKNEALSLVNRANTLWRMGKYREAESALDEASSIMLKVDAGTDVASWLHVVRARIALSQRLFPKAKSEGLRALALSGTTLKGTIAEASYAVGLSEAFSGAPREGRIKCEKAVAVLTSTGDVPRLSEALLALAEATLQSGDSKGALDFSRRAQEMLAHLGKQDLEWLAWLTYAGASRKAGDEDGALRSAGHATDLLSKLQQKWGPDHYASYLARPDITFFRKQLSEFVR